MPTSEETKPHLIILSDLWGIEEAHWLRHYEDALQNHFQLSILDTPKLAGVETHGKNQKAIHEQFLEGGIDRAVHRLGKMDKTDIILGMSIGGLIAWKSILQGMSVQQLIAVSATRLRYEMVKPTTNITLFYGEKDDYQPNGAWIDEMGIETTIIANADHQLYKDSIFISHISQLLTNGVQ